MRVYEELLEIPLDIIHSHGRIEESVGGDELRVSWWAARLKMEKKDAN